METSLIKEYKQTLSQINNLIKITSNEDVRISTKKILVDFINDLYRVEKDEAAYKKLLEEYGLGSDCLIDLNSDNLLDKYTKELENIFNYPNEESIKVWLKNVLLYGNDCEIDFSRVKDYIKKCFDKFDNDNKFSFKLDMYINEIVETINNNLKEDKRNNDTLKICNIKRSYNSRMKNDSLLLKSLIGMGGLSNNVLGIGAFQLYKKGNNTAKDLITKCGLTLDNDDKLINDVGKEVNKQDVSRIKYDLIRKTLSKVSNDGFIDKEYKKNRLTSMLLNVPLIDKIKDRFGKVEVSKFEEQEEVMDINNGMRLIK